MINHRSTLTALTAGLALLAVASGSALGADRPVPATSERPAGAERPVAGITTYVTAPGATSQMRCDFSDDPDMTTECGDAAGDGDGMLNAFKRRGAVRAYTRTIDADGRQSHVLTDFVRLDGGRRLLIQAVGVDNATVVCKLDGGCFQVRRRAGKQELVRELADEGKLTTRLRRSLQGEDPFLKD